MKRLLIATGLALALAALGGGVALADGGPHGGYDRMVDGTAGLTDACAGCHRVHQGLSTSKLLKAAKKSDVCLTCHNGQGSRLDVLDGVKLAAVNAGATGEVVAGGTLNGGGFDYVNGEVATSRHNVERTTGNGGTADPGASNPWGYLGDTGSEASQLPAADRPLSCANCHNPHGSANYRLIKEKVNDKFVSVLAYGTTSSGTYGWTKQEGGRGLDTTGWPNIPTDKYTKEWYGGAGLESSGGLSFDYNSSGGTTLVDSAVVTGPGMTGLNGFALLCSACHTSYASKKGDNIVDQPGGGWSITKYRHRIEMPYKDWASTKYASITTDGKVPCNPETEQFVPSAAEATDNKYCASATATYGGATGTPLPALRLASGGQTGGQDNNNIVTCLTCHRAHGTPSTMTGFALYNTFDAAGKELVEISPAQKTDTAMALNNSKSTSMLLFTNNRGMCEACHQW